MKHYLRISRRWLKEWLRPALVWLMLGLMLGLLPGSPAAAQPGTPAFGPIVRLNGSTDRIAAPAPAFGTTDNFTLEAYVRPAALPTGGFETIINNGFDNGVAGNGLALGIGGGAGGSGGSQLVVLLSGLQFFDTGFTFPAAGQWYHVAVTRRSGTTFAYVDGVQAPNTTTATPQAPTGQFSVGAQNGIRFLNGEVDEARAWAVGRTQAQIQATMSAELAGNEAGLVAYWDMNRSGQGAGLTVLNQATATGASLDGTTAGTASTPVFLTDAFGNAVTMNGSTDYVEIAANPALQLSTDATVEAWARPSGFSTQKILFINCINPDNWGILLATSAGGFGQAAVVIGGTQFNLTGATPLAAGEWVHLAAVREGTSLRLYRNGLLDGTLTIPGGSLRNGVGQSRIGAAQNASPSFFAGAIDEVRVWSTACSQADIQSRLNAQLLGTETGLAAYFDMNRSGQGAGLTVLNQATATGAALNGTTVGTASTPVFSLAGNPGVIAAGTFTVAGLAPPRNANTAPTASSVALSFSQDVQAATAANVRVFSAQAGGRKAGAASVSGNTLTFDPASNFGPGEVVQATVPATVLSLLGTPAAPHVHQFTTAAGVGPGLFSKRTVVNVGTGLGAALPADVDADGDLDLVVADGSLNTVSIRLNNGDASYSGGSTVGVGNRPGCLVVADLDGDGDLDFATGNETDNTVSVRFNNGSGAFSGSTTVATGNFQPRSIRAGDVDGDGDLDLVVANNTNTGTVRPLLNDGTGLGYTNAPDVTGIIFPIGLALGDVDGDGDLDLAISSNLIGGTDVFLRLNNGSGTFSGGGTIPVGSSSIYADLADVDGDGDLDLLAANIGSDDVSVRLNNGSGAFSGGSTVSVGDRPCYLAVADLDGDGDLDFATANNSTPGSLSFRFNNGSGAFSGTLNAAAGNQPLSVAAGDADGDGDLDVAMIEGAQTAVYLNQPAPTITSFNPTSGTPGTLVTLTGTNFLGAVGVSFNGTATVPASVPSGTSLTVLVPIGATSGPISVTTGSGTGTSAGSFTVVLPSLNVTALSPGRNANAAPRPTDVAITFDQAPAPATASNVRVFSAQAGGRRAGAATAAGNTITFNPAADFRAGEVVRVSVPGSVQSTGGSAAVPQVYQFTAAAAGGPLTFSGSTVPTAAGPVGVTLADVDSDADLDMLVASFTAGTVSLRRNNGSGAFSGSEETGVGANPRGIATADLDGDGDLDLLVANSGSNTVSVRFNDGSGAFSGVQNVSVGTGATDVAPGDVDGDGDLDFVAVSFSTNSLSIRLNNGSGTFGGSGSVSTGAGSGPFFIALADTDGDGDLDALASNNTSGGVGLYLNNGGGTFSSGGPVSTGAGARGLTTGDVDGDGDLDLVTVNGGASTVSINLNNAGTFGSPTTLPTSAAALWPALGDLDGDGDLDLLLTDGTVVGIRLNSGSGSFGPASTVPVGAGAQALAVADLDGDHDLDFAAANANESTVSVRLSQPAPAITAFTPGSGSIGSYVTLTGTGFLGTTGISFNGTPAPVFTIASATSATVQVPAGTTSGLITLTTGSGTATSASSFTVVPAMTLLSVAPTRHRLAVAPGTHASATFSETLDPASLTPAAGIPPALRVFGQETGRRSGGLAVSGSTLTLAPSQGFRAGERVAASLPAGVVRGSSGGAGPGTVWQFTTAVAGGSGSFFGGPDLSAGSGLASVHPGDFDGDGDLDLLFTGFPAASVGLLRNTGSLSFAAGPATTVGAAPVDLALGDLDADGDLDFATANSGTNTVSLRFNDGTGTFGGSQQVGFGTNARPQQVLLLDLDADADLDLLTLVDGTGSRAVQLHLNNGAGGFTSAGSLPLGSAFPEVMTAGDVDNDGDFDLLVGYSSNLTGDGTHVYRNNGAAGLTLSNDVSTFRPGALSLQDVDADGDLDLVQLTTFGSGTTSLLTFFNPGSGPTGAPASLSLGSGNDPRRLTLADVDADGDLDALVSLAGANAVALCLNNGSGGFAAPANTPVASFPTALATGDVDNDGDVDLLAAASGANAISLRLNQAAPAATITAFAPTSGPVGTTVTITGTNLGGTTGVSFNGTAASFSGLTATGLTAVVPAGATTGPIAITTLANGTASTSSLTPGVFTVTAVPLLVTARSPLRHANSAPPASSVALTFSASVNPATAANVRVFSGQAGGRRAGAAAASGSVVTFNPTADFRPGEKVSVSVPATVLGSSGEVAVPHVYQFLAATSGGGSFGTPGTVAVGSQVIGVALAEVSGDGRLDLLSVSSNSAGTVRIQLGNGAGGFGSPQTLSVGNSPGELAVGDVDGDGDLDLVTANQTGNSVSLATNTGGVFSVVQTVSAGAEAGDVALADIDGDGDLDLLTTKRLANAVGISLNDGNGIFDAMTNTGTGSGTLPRRLALADVDNDGDLDLLTGNQSNSVSLLRNNGAGSFGSLTQLSTPGGSSLSLGDLDSDGDLDLAVAEVGNGVEIFRNAGGSFSSVGTVAVGFNPRDVALADIDGDGDLDLLTANSNDNTASVRLNDGSGSFGPAPDVPVGSSAQRLALADIDNDGDLDLAVSNFSDNTVSIGLNGTPAPTPAISSFTPTHAVVGASVVVSGTHLTGATGVSFNGTAAPGFTVNAGGTQLTVSVPAGATTGPIAISTPSGTATSAVSFELDLVLNATATIPAGEYHDVTVAGGTATLGGDVAINGTLAVQAGTTFVDNCALVTGGGNFTLAAGATLHVCHPLGLAPAGAIQTTGANSFSSDASYVFDGSSAQATGAGLPARVRNLTAANPAGLTLTVPTSVAQVLTLAGSGNFDLNGQAFTLLSDASGTALVVNAGTGLVLGSAVVQRYISPSLNPGRGYRHFSAPVSGQAVGGLGTAQSPVVVNPLYNTSPTPGTVTPFPTIFGYDESRVPAVGNTVAEFDKGWVSPASALDAMPVGRGYTLQAVGNETIRFSGPLNSGNLSRTGLSHGSGPQAGWHLLGNAYPAPLDWSTLDAGSFVNMGSAVYVFQSTGQYTGSYRVYQAGIGDPIIALGQGVFVRSTAPNAALHLTNANRVTTFSPSGSQLLRNADRRPQLHLALRGPGSAAPDPVYIYFDPAASAGLDAHADAYKLRNPGLPSLFCQLGPEELSVNGLAPLTSLDVVVPLGLAVPRAGTYTLTADQLLNFGGTAVYLRDAQSGALINLRQQPGYSFTVAAGALGSSTRFSVLFRPSAPTANAAGLEASQVALFPNPARHEVTLLIPALPAAKSIKAELLNALGQVVFTRSVLVGSNGVHTRFDLRGLAAGVYSLRLSAGNATPLTKRLVVE